MNSGLASNISGSLKVEMNSSPDFNWSFLVANPDPGIRDIISRILDNLSPRDIQSLRHVNRELRGFIDKEESKITNGLYKLKMTFPYDEYSMGYKHDQSLLGLVEYNVIVRIMYDHNQSCRHFFIFGPILDVQLTAWHYHQKWPSNQSEVLTKIQDDIRNFGGQVRLGKTKGRYSVYITGLEYKEHK